MRVTVDHDTAECDAVMISDESVHIFWSPDPDTRVVPKSKMIMGWDSVEVDRGGS
jgi:hypothetical protein